MRMYALVQGHLFGEKAVLDIAPSAVGAAIDVDGNATVRVPNAYPARMWLRTAMAGSIGKPVAIRVAENVFVQGILEGVHGTTVTLSRLSRTQETVLRPHGLSAASDADEVLSLLVAEQARGAAA